MTTNNCSTYNSQETCNNDTTNNCKWYSYDDTNKCVDKSTIIPISSYVFQAYQRKTVSNSNSTNKHYIDIYVNKYKSAKYTTLTLEPLVSKINITLTYNNGKSARSAINIAPYPVSNNNTNKYDYTSITNPSITRPNNLKPKPEDGETDQYFTFYMPPNVPDQNNSFNKSSIPTHLRLDVSNITSSPDNDINKLFVKNIQYEDSSGNRSIFIKVVSLDDDEIAVLDMKNKINGKVSLSNDLLNENKNIINYIKDKTERRIE
jgi:hypothetical protein